MLKPESLRMIQTAAGRGWLFYAFPESSVLGGKGTKVVRTWSAFGQVERQWSQSSPNLERLRTS
ncbi:hypothetical protein [Peribacillus kribbensis]|uniref:hypothetical protein n=1 Tax=Peribacillus kribbensis TaxID=356658 RepID=UPI00047E319D|nr:hypothetical protein [Peribacillus kribbensis]